MRSFLLIIIFNLGYGNIEFTPHNLNVGEKGILSIHSTDINGDGNVDLLYSSIETNSITWLENKGNGSFTPHILSSQINGSISIFPIDLNRDGKMDIVSASMYDNSINWYKNSGGGNLKPLADFLSSNEFKLEYRKAFKNLKSEFNQIEKDERSFSNQIIQRKKNYEDKKTIMNNILPKILMKANLPDFLEGIDEDNLLE